MSDIAAANVTACAAPWRPLPPGFGLLASALVSLALWGSLFWLAGAVV